MVRLCCCHSRTGSDRQQIVNRLKQALTDLDHVANPADKPGIKLLREGLRHLDAVSPQVVATTPLGGAHVDAQGPRIKFADAVLQARKQAAESMHEGALAPALNQLVSYLWPTITHYLEDLVRNEIEPAIDSSLPHMCKGKVKFTKVSFGKSSPRFGPLYVERHDSAKAIALHVGIELCWDLDVQITALGILVGITEISFKGDLIVLFTPLINKPPFFGSIQIYFSNAPKTDIKFVGAARVADLPVVRGAIRQAIDDSIAGLCVLPRRITLDMDEEDQLDITDLTYPEPVGVLRLTIYSAENLIAADFGFLSAPTSDPYFVAKLGIETWISPVRSRTLNPVWGEGEGIVADFPVHHDGQIVNLQMFDSDLASDDLIAKANPIDVKSLIEKSHGSRCSLPFQKANGDAGGGTVTLSARMLKLSIARIKKVCEPSVAHLSVKLTKMVVDDETAQYPYKIRIRVKSRESVIPMRRSFSALFSQSEDDKWVVTERTTAPSVPRAWQEMSDSLKNICVTLAGRGHIPSDIANIVDCGLPEVDYFLRASALDEDRCQAEAVKEANEAREAHIVHMSTRQPHFDEVVQMLVPPVDDSGKIELMVLDKNAKSLGVVEVNFAEIFFKQDLRFEGPFITDTGIKIHGNMVWRWLSRKVNIDWV